MSRKRERKPLDKVTLNLLEGQKERLRALHPEMSVAKTIREIIDAHFARVDKKLAERGLQQEEQA